MLIQHIFGCWSSLSAAHSIIKCWHGVNSLIRGTIDFIECWYKYILHFMLVHKLWLLCTILLANSHFCQPFYFKLPYEFQPAPCRQTPKIFKSIKFHVVFILTTSRSHISQDSKLLLSCVQFLNMFIRLHRSPGVMERHLTKRWLRFLMYHRFWPVTNFVRNFTVSSWSFLPISLVLLP